MKRPSKLSRVEEIPAPPVADDGAILQIKVWLTAISPMIWRRVLVPATFTLRELHGLIQVAMAWEGIHPVTRTGCTSFQPGGWFGIG